MKIKIYQINMDRDNGSYSFTNYENTIRRTGGGIRSSIYDCVFDGEVACKGLEEVYEKFNIDSPPGFKGHSLSVSDIVEIAESDSVEKGYYFCDSIGFKKIDFEPEKAEKNMDNKITVVLVEPASLPVSLISGQVFPNYSQRSGVISKPFILMRNKSVSYAMMRVRFAGSR